MALASADIARQTHFIKHKNSNERPSSSADAALDLALFSQEKVYLF
jgi:hypothetical protein